MKRTSSTYPLLLTGLVTLALIISAIRPHDYFTWLLEVLPVLIAAPILFLTYRRFRFSNLSYTLIAIHSLVLIIGGHYTYALTPIGDWMSAIFGFTRNNYDKIGHFMQGFVPVILTRELLLRTSPLKKGLWLHLNSVAIPLALSVFYEFIEWWISLLTGSAGDSFLGTQGYIWDTQSDMFLCFIGTIIALVVLRKVHDRSIQKLRKLKN